MLLVNSHLTPSPATQHAPHLPTSHPPPAPSHTKHENTSSGMCFHVRRVPDHRPHVQLLLHPIPSCWTRKTRPRDVFFVSSGSPTTPLMPNLENTPTWVCFRCSAASSSPPLTPDTKNAPPRACFSLRCGRGGYSKFIH